MHQEAFVARSRSVDAILSAAGVDDFTTLNDGADVSDVALQVLRRAGWIPWCVSLSTRDLNGRGDADMNGERPVGRVIAVTEDVFGDRTGIEPATVHHG
jgi:hypothetical protein